MSHGKKDLDVTTQSSTCPEATTMVRTNRLSVVGRAVFAVSLSIALFFLTIGVTFGSVGTFIRYSRGETLVVDELDKSFGDVTVGENSTISFKLTNIGWSPIKILGCSIGCACTVPETLPMVVSPGETRPFRYTLRTRETSRPESIFLKSVLYTNIPRQREIHVTLSAVLKARDSSPTGGLGH